MSFPDLAHGDDAAAVSAGMGVDDGIRWRPVATVDKYDADQTAWVARKSGIATPDGSVLERYVKPYESVVAPGNLLTTAGLQRITNLIIGAGGQAATNTAARIGTGNASTAAAVGNTDLAAVAGAANRWFQVMDATFPTAVNGLMTFRSTFASADGNYVWSEWGIDVAAAAASSAVVNATLLNRAVAALGTKASGASWVITATITLS